MINTKPYYQAIAIEKIDHFFVSFKFNIIDFCNELKLPEKDSEKFLSHLLQCIYYHEIIDASLNGYNNNSLEFLLISLLAETIGEVSLKNILVSFSDKKRLQLLCHSVNHMREGAWIVLNAFQDIFEPKSIWMDLLRLLKNKYFDPKEFENLITAHVKLDVEKVFEILSEKAELQVREILRILPPLIDSMITSSLRGFDLLEKLKKEDPQYIPSHQEDDLRKQALESTYVWKERFSKSLPIDYSEKDGLDFFKFYGLNGYYLPSVKQDFRASLIDLLNILLNLFENPLYMDPRDIPNHLLFVLNITEKLHAFHKIPHVIVKNINDIVYTLSTRGLHFSKLSWLPSLLSAISQLQKHLESKTFLLPNFPILVFDQAEHHQFEENNNFINKLKKKYNLNIWHLSKKEILQLASKLKITKWIFTETKDGEEIIGFGGSRNFQLLLAPVIHGAILKGVKEFQELMNLKDDEILKIFQNKILKSETFVHLGEDDVALLPCHVFAGILWAGKYKDYYCMKSGLAIGRNTSYVTPFVDLTNILHNPSRLFVKWSDNPFSAGMKEQITKLKFCLPTPFGNEEQHVQTLSTDYDFFLPPVLHLAETRFPGKLFPESPFDGLDNYLKAYVPYSMQISLMTSLIDAENKHLRNILPWNDEEVKLRSPPTSLHDLLVLVFKKSGLAELKKRFWQNFYDLFSNLDNPELPIGGDILKLSQLNLKDEVFTTSSLSISLIDYYTFVKKDALFFIELGATVMKFRKEGTLNFVENAIEHVENQMDLKITDLPISKSLYILIHLIESFEELDLESK